MRIRSGRSSHNTPFRIGRLSSVDAANATCPTSLCTTPAGAFHAPSNFTAGNDGNSSRGRPSSLNFDRPHSIPTRASPAAVTRTGPEGSSRAMSTSFLAGRVTAPSASTSAGTVVLTAMSRSVPERRTPCLVASTRTLARTGSVVLAGIAAATALKPSCSCSRVIVNFICAFASPRCRVRIYCYPTIELLVVVVEAGEMLGNRLRRARRVRVLVPHASDPNVGSVGIRGLPHAARAFPHRPTTSLPTCGLECGQLLAGHFDALLEGAIPHHLPLHLVDRVDHGRVVPSPERLPDLHQLHAEHVAREVHRDLPWDRQRLGAGLGAQSLGRHPPPTGHHFLDAIDARRRLRAVAGGVLSLTDLVRERLAGELDRHLAVLE